MTSLGFEKRLKEISCEVKSGLSSSNENESRNENSNEISNEIRNKNRNEDRTKVRNENRNEDRTKASNEISNKNRNENRYMDQEIKTTHHYGINSKIDSTDKNEGFLEKTSSKRNMFTEKLGS